MALRVLRAVLLAGALGRALWSMPAGTADEPAGKKDDAGGSPASPRVAELQKRLGGGDAKAAEAFWDKVKAEGTPLVEPIPGEPAYVLVTFLWRGRPDTKNVV